jgi:hypothetical protein
MLEGGCVRVMLQEHYLCKIKKISGPPNEKFSITAEMYTFLYHIPAVLPLSAVIPPACGWGGNRIIYTNVKIRGSDAEKSYTVYIDPADHDENGFLAEHSLRPFCDFQKHNKKKAFLIDFSGASQVKLSSRWDWSWGSKQLKVFQELPTLAETEVGSERTLMHYVERRLDSRSLNTPPQSYESYKVRFTNLVGESRVYYARGCACGNKPFIRPLHSALSFEDFVGKGLKQIDVSPCEGGIPDGEPDEVPWHCFDNIARRQTATETKVNWNASHQEALQGRVSPLVILLASLSIGL